MKFSLATPEDTKKVLANATKVKAHLTTGIIEILDKHQDLLGQVSINLLEVESNDDNKTEKFKFILQNAVVIVSTKGINAQSSSIQSPETGVYVYAKRIVEINTSLSIEEFSKKVELKSTKLELEKQLLTEAEGGKAATIKAKILYLEDELKFEKKVLQFIKESRN
jgi:F0F1-type ATP synthase epsilon subunit